MIMSVKNHEENTVWMIQIENIDVDSTPFFLEYLESISESASCFENQSTKLWTVQLYTRQKPANDKIEEKLSIISKAFSIDKPIFTVDKVPDTNWVAESQKNFQPIDIGRFYIFPSWHEQSAKAEKISIEIDPEMAFGTGEHNTTKGCLQAIEKLGMEHSFVNCLDMGCGSGILAIATAKIWPKANVIAVDIDEIAVETTIKNIKQNKVTKQIKAACNDGYNSKLVIDNSPYDFIVSNILARPLIEYAEDLSKNLQNGGFAVLSGFYEADSPKVFKAFKKLGFRKINETVSDGWSTLTLSRD